MIYGKRTVVYEPTLSNLHPNAICGDDCVIHSHVWVGNGVVIGHHCKIQAFAFIPKGVTIKDHVFIGPRVTFTNDKHPPSHGIDWQSTLVESRVVIGAGAIILPGITIHEGAKVGAGAVVTASVPPGLTVVGNPARQIDTKRRGI